MAWLACGRCCRRSALYLLTFVQVGIYWVNHHYLVDEVETVSHGILWANLIFLFCLSLFPFVTDWIGTKGLSPFSTALYAAVSILPGCVLHGIVDPGADPERSATACHMGQTNRVVRVVSRGNSSGVLQPQVVVGDDRRGRRHVAAAAESRPE